MHFLLLALILILFPACSPQNNPQQTLSIFSAASLTDALNEITALFEKQYDITAKVSYASSSTLARQIEQGAPAQFYISANEKWMDYLVERKLIITETRKNWLSNTLVLIAPQNSNINNIEIKKPFDLKVYLPENFYIAMGDPDHVPAGIYAKQALENLETWENIQNNIARVDSVRAALAMVSRAEVPLGIVYNSDAIIDPQVKIIGEFPEKSHSKIIYPIAIIEKNPTTELFLAFLQTKAVQDIAIKYGFKVL